jgi:hypothetical protein
LVTLLPFISEFQISKLLSENHHRRAMEGNERQQNRGSQPQQHRATNTLIVRRYLTATESHHGQE